MCNVWHPSMTGNLLVGMKMSNYMQCCLQVTAQKKKAAGKVRKEAKLRGAVTKPVRETRAAKIRGVWSVEGCGAMALSPADLAKLGQHAKTGKPGKRASRFLAKQSCTLS